MPLIANPPSPIVGKLEGIHLFHFDGAPCAQRVRFALAEKGLKRGREVKFDSGQAADCQGEENAWVSRRVSLVKKQHMTPAYALIQPNLVVPALVHDGALYTESMDIVEYIDNVFGGDPLLPKDNPELLAEVQRLTAQGKALHRSIRFVTFRWGLGRLGQLNAKEEASLRQLLNDNGDEEQLINFYESYDNKTIPDHVYEDHLQQLIDGFQGLEEQLADGRKFLTGDTLTMADIIWAMKLLRLDECGFPFAHNFPNLYAWHQGIVHRPAFIDGVMGKHQAMHTIFKLKSRLESLLGKGLKQQVLRQMPNH